EGGWVLEPSARAAGVGKKTGIFAGGVYGIAWRVRDRAPAAFDVRSGLVAGSAAELSGRCSVG
ncbi:MAG: hypothetical protein ACRDRN_25295, partial [Sciscionella sp.]